MKTDDLYYLAGNLFAEVNRDMMYLFSSVPGLSSDCAPGMPDEGKLGDSGDPDRDES